MIVVNSNLLAKRTARGLGESRVRVERSFSKLSSGSAVTSAKDNQAYFNGGLRASTKTRSTNYAVRNIASGVSLVQTAESATRSLQENVQRIRELAVQAASSTITDDIRFSMQVEVDALIEEINLQAKNANEGGIHLLDGSAQSLNFMVGIDSGDIVRLDLESMTAKDLGRMVREIGFDVDASQSLQAGDLVINGISVRGTVSTDDLNSSADNTGSALAKAKAINAQSGLTNVRADALETIVFGDAVVGGTLDNNNNITINGETITDLVIEGADGSNTLVGAINAAYEKTGVLAVLDDLGALTLTADDGRNIEITTSSAAAAAATGLNEGVADTVVTGGAIQLVSNEQIKLELTSVGTDGAIGFGAGLGTSYLSYTPDTYIETVAITSQEEARRTIDIADSALDRLRRHVSKMGAVTNRLDHVLQSVTTEQMAAQQTQSSMLDVDFASEVVELTRQTIAQETQSAVMAQANSSGASALTLLDGLASLGFGATSFGTGAFSSSLGQRAPVFSGLKFFS